MFKFCNLYSGSSGNCSFVGTSEVNILIDCGESQKKIINALESIGQNISNINAIIVTHEHSDHVKTLGAISKKYNIPVYANEKTFNNMPEQTELIKEEQLKKIENLIETAVSIAKISNISKKEVEEMLKILYEEE